MKFLTIFFLAPRFANAQTEKSKSGGVCFENFGGAKIIKGESNTAEEEA